MAQNSGVFNTTSVASAIANGTWPKSKAQSVQLLMVGAGGGGAAGGGGGGGVLSMDNLPVTPGTSYSVTVGAGGASASGTAGAGGNSTFGSNLTVIGGGGGQWRGQGSTTQGGSGGGGPADTSNSFPGGGYPGQGNPGGGDLSGYSAAPGGGGAGSAGDPVFRQFSNTAYNGQGGIGVHSLISGSLVSYGNGAAGAYSATNLNGTTGTGNGATGTSATGGSGNVIVSYSDLNAAATTTGSVSATSSGVGSIFFSNSSPSYLYPPQTTQAPLNIGTGNFTIEFWAYAASLLGNGTGLQVTISSYGAASYDFQIGLSATNYLYMQFGGTGGGVIYNTATPAAFPTGQWNHCVFVRSGSNCALFTNGVRYGTVSNSSSVNLNPLQIGTYGGSLGSYSMYGSYLSNLKISNVAIYDPTQTTLTVPTKPFAAISSTVFLLNTSSFTPYAETSSNNFLMTTSGTLTWANTMPFEYNAGFQNRVYSFTGTGTITF
jgi:hypothetical protein